MIRTNKVDYLESTIFINPNNKYELLRKVFFKPTNTHQLLHTHTHTHTNLFIIIIHIRVLLSQKLLVSAEYAQNNQSFKKHGIPHFKHYINEIFQKMAVQY